jgi:hypothetical protein
MRRRNGKKADIAAEHQAHQLEISSLLLHSWTKRMVLGLKEKKRSEEKRSPLAVASPAHDPFSKYIVLGRRMGQWL